jgi:predicted esterase
MPFATNPVDGTALHFLERGNPTGEVVLLVHGFGSSAERNWLSAGWERPLADAGYRLVLVDLRGHGDSARPDDPLGYRLSTLSEDTFVVLDSLGIENAHWLGYSLGSRIGLEAARTAPNRFRSLSLGGVAARELEAAELIAAIAGLPGGATESLISFAHGVAIDPPPFPVAPVGIPTLVSAGSMDEVALGSNEFARRLGADYVQLPGRTHTNAITARAFKEAVVRHLNRYSIASPDHDGTTRFPQLVRVDDPR